MLNNLSIDDRQFGKKIGKHAQDYGLNPRSASDRARMVNIINNIVDNYDEIRQGTWPGQSGEVIFYIKGDDVIIANGSAFVSILEGGITNSKVVKARSVQND